MQKWRLVLEYDGEPFAGWQLQAGQPTVQGAVEAALEPLLGHAVRIGGAGRTDSGVHAAMQVACFVTETERTPKAIRDGLNARLPASVACLEAAPVPVTFDPRHAPHTKTYRYTWLVSPTRRPLRQGRAWHVRQALNVAAMRGAALALQGTHDFSSFRAAGCSATHPVRTVEQVRVRSEGDEIWLQILGTGFLRHMVRIVAGTLHEVGRGRRDEAWFRDVLEARDRGRAGRTAPPQGLLLERIDYAAVVDAPGDGPDDGYV